MNKIGLLVLIFVWFFLGLYFLGYLDTFICYITDFCQGLNNG